MQRVYALRAGVNIVMYMLTGNYKSDQVHVPVLLERLGQDELVASLSSHFCPGRCWRRCSRPSLILALAGLVAAAARRAAAARWRWRRLPLR